MGLFSRALCALPLVAALFATPASATMMLAKISGDWNDDPYFRTWSMEVIYNGSSFQNMPNKLYSWDGAFQEGPAPIHSVKGSVFRSTCMRFEWECVPELVEYKIDLDLNDIDYMKIEQDGIFWTLSFGGPDSAFRVGHIMASPPYVTPNESLYISGYGDYGSGAAHGVNFGMLHTHVVDISPAGIPEPSTWALMITGFGLAGGAIRRGRRQALAA